MSKTTILYKDVAPGADEDAAVSSPSPASVSNISLLPFGVPDVALVSLEIDRWLLDGAYEIAETDRVAFWSDRISEYDGSFLEDPVITLEFEKQYSSVGITLVFDPAGGEWCSVVNIKWYQAEELKDDRTFFPDSASYFCYATVTAYDKVVITIKSTSKPYRRARINQILFGTYRPFDMTEIRSASITNETSLIALETPISTMKWDVDSRDDVEFMFQLKQPVEVRNDNNLIGVYYIDGSSRMGKGYYSIDCYDAFGVLDEYPFPGGVYSGKSAKELISEIVGDDFTVDSTDVQDTALTGIITASTKREAIHQILFAWGVTASTDGTNKIRIFSVPSTPKEVDQNWTFTGVSVSTESIVTEVRVTAHTYTQDADGSVEIGGVKYAETTTVYTVKNPNVTATDKQNVKEITDATLVSPDIGQAVAQRVYDYYQRRNTQSASVVWRGEQLGDALTIPNAWGSVNTGNVQKMQIKLSNTVVADVESVGV